MEEKQSDSKFKELLDKLQQESWQLELLISGFAIFGLINAIEPLNIIGREAAALESQYKVFYFVAKTSCYILIINLIIHVILRGLWIGAIGLRYVSNEIDYEELNYSKRFTQYLKKRVGSFDDYIAKLENYCSILFAVTFLTLFYFISIFTSLFLVFYLAGSIFIESGLFSEFTGTAFLGFFGIFYFLFAFVVFIDFITQGGLKKKEWTSLLYMPIYKVFSILTLSFLYRPLVYNFLDNKFGRRLAFILVPVYAVIFFISTLNNVRSNYISISSESSINYAKNNNYLNLLKENQFVKNVAIESKIISKPYLKIFIPFKKNIENTIIESSKDLKPLEDSRGLKSTFFEGLSKVFNNEKKDPKKTDSIYKKYLNAFSQNYFLKIDTTKVLSNFNVTEINNQLGFETIIPTKNISEGKHLLKIDRKNFNKRSKKIQVERFAHIPFWYYKK
ncbi:hypothetical protein [Tenacibaculum sp. 1_MG-2023]|uniref:hypothetical protein n=1 Tax=Tenacibaculum sp. 1_MG-2023 TaxID=3062653 RepID=UPI0026E3FE83|nr:hypothetical protein [Tenacibaculum sp. 1_MG-2023]MDO6600024.1 hypothetical protein [Tenacibaculum sp. 1_MG-2023]